MIIKEIRLKKVSFLTNLLYRISIKLATKENLGKIQKYFKNSKIIKFDNSTR